VEFTALEADTVPLVRLNRPQLTVAGSDYPYAVTITQAQADRIYYTLDGSHPAPANPQAHLHDPADPVIISAPALFRCRAFGPDGDLNTIPSDTNAHNFV
jgi:hypothetical protein